MPKATRTDRPKIGDAVAADAKSALDRREESGPHGRRAAILGDDLRFPDSAVALGALDLTRSVSPDFLLNHALRTYLFGVALARRDGLRVDREIFFLGAVMHDLGLTERFAAADRFEVNGADAARAYLAGQNYDAQKADIIHQAIALHTQSIALDREPEIALVRVGAGVDVIGARYDDIAPEAIERILADWPRRDFKTCFHGLLAAEAQRLPGSPAGHMIGNGLGDMIHAAPFAD